MKDVILERRMSIFDVKLPFRMSENQADRWYSLLRGSKNPSPLAYIRDITPQGNYIQSKDMKTNVIRVEVDTRWVSDAEAVEAITAGIISIRQQNK